MMADSMSAGVTGSVYPASPVNPLALFKPEYLYRPSQIIRRARVALLGRPAALLGVPLSFGGSIEVWPRDVIGRALNDLGVYDLAVSEVVWRLTQTGETVIDIGANIGYFTRLFGTRVGVGGRVIAFEAHPVLFDELRTNVARHVGGEPELFELRHEAVSSAPGSVLLGVPLAFSRNRGICHVVEEGSTAVSPTTIEVPSVRLDDIIDPEAHVGVVKMDVEGHEHAVLAGAERILSSQQVRDWVFEDLTGQSDVVQTFESHGYAVFLIERRFRRPVLTAERRIDLKGRWEPPSLVATLDAGRALRLCDGPGWKVLSQHKGRQS